MSRVYAVALIAIALARSGSDAISESPPPSLVNAEGQMVMLTVGSSTGFVASDSVGGAMLLSRDGWATASIRLGMGRRGVLDLVTGDPARGECASFAILLGLQMRPFLAANDAAIAYDLCSSRIRSTDRKQWSASQRLDDKETTRPSSSGRWITAPRALT